MTPAVGYTEMKDSGVHWIGQIPKEWKVQKLFRCFGLIGSGTTPKSQVEDYYNGNIPWLQSGDINGGIVKSTAKSIKEIALTECSALHMYNAPFIAVAMYGASIANTSIVAIDACTNQACCVLSSPQNGIDYKFVFYAILSAKEELLLCARGGTQPNISQEILKQFRLPLPSLQEQTAIAAYLDTQCAKIDEIIAEAKASIEDYKQWKASIIYEAVTKGLDPDAEMKESCVQWIGQMPSTWGLKKAKNCVSITNGSDPKTEGNIPVYGSGAESFKTCGEYKNGPAVLIGRKGATLHIPHYISGRYWNVDTAFDVRAKEGFSLKYYYYLACSFDYKYYISQTTLPSMTQTNYNNICLPFPPAIVQEEICRFLDNSIAKIDELITEKQSLISDLESYKQSLIYEVVTGKRRVC